MRVQLDRFEDNGMAVLLLYPHGKASFDVPQELLPKDARAGTFSRWVSRATGGRPSGWRRRMRAL
jgi:hypothetical protein